MRTNPEHNPHVSPPRPCPGCGKTLNRNRHAEGQQRRPNPGEVAVCFHCGQMMRYGSELSLIALSMDEVKALPEPVQRSLALASMQVLAAKVLMATGSLPKPQLKGPA